MRLVMKIRCKLFLFPLALGLLTSSCKENESKGAENVEIPAKAPKATPEERASVLGSVAMVPAGSSLVVSVYDIPGIVRDARATHVGAAVLSLCGGKSGGDVAVHEAVSAETQVDPGSLMDGESKDVPVSKDEAQPTLPEGAADMDVPVKDVVISLGSSQPEFIAKLAPLVSSFYKSMNASSVMTMGKDFLKNGPAKEKLSAMAMELMEKNLVGDLASLMGELDLSPSQGTAPFLAIATLAPEVKAQVEQTIGQVSSMAGMFTQGMVTPYSTKAAGLDFKGVVVDGKMCSMALKQLIASQKDEVLKKALIQTNEKLQECKLYVLTAFKGDRLVSVICTNPEQQIRLAANPSDSVLGQDDFSFVDGYLKNRVAGISYMSPDMLKSWVAYTSLTMKSMYQGYADGLQRAAGVFGASPETAESVSASIARIGSFYEKFLSMSDLSMASTAVAWREGGLKIVGASGLTSMFDYKEAGTLSGVNLQALPGSALTAFYSLTPETMELYCSVFEDAVIGTWGAVSFVMSSSDSNAPDEYRMYYHQVKAIEPEIKKVWQSMKLYVSSISGSRGVAVKLDGDVPACLTDKLHGMKFPQIAAVEKLRDRKKLDEAWSLFSQSVNEAAGKLGTPAPFGVLMTPGQTGNNHWLKMDGVFDQKFQPVATVDDSILVLGLSPDFNQSVFKAAATPVSGNANVLGMSVHIPSWIGFISDCIKANKGDKAGDVIPVLNALSRDLEAIDWSVSKDGNSMIQKIEFKAAH